MRLFHLSTRNAEPVEKSRVSRLFIIVGYTFIIIIFFCSLVNAKSRALDATTGTHALAIDSSSFSFIPFKVFALLRSFWKILLKYVKIQRPVRGNFWSIHPRVYLLFIRMRLMTGWSYINFFLFLTSSKFHISHILRAKSVTVAQRL